MSDARSIKSDGSRWRRYLHFWGPDIDADIDDELGYHIEMRTQDFVARGMSPDDARAAAIAAFGDPRTVATALRAHDARRLRQARRADMLQDLAYDVRYGLRQLRNAPRFTVSVVAVLALGVGANTAIFSAIDAAFFRPLPFASPRQLVVVNGAQLPTERSPSRPKRPKIIPELADLQAANDVFTNVAAYAVGGLNLVGGREPVRATVTFVTRDFFNVLGRAPAVGRSFTTDEATLNGPGAVVLSYGLWQRQFGGERAVVGHRVTLNDKTYTVVGVMPRDFRYPRNTDLWIALPLPVPMSTFEAFRNYLPSVFIARLAPGMTSALAVQRVEAIAKRFSVERISSAPPSETVRPLQQALVGDRKTALTILMGSAALLLLIACANVTNLLLSRAATRQREIAVRVVLGATRLRVIRQLVVESLILALLGGLVALVVARVGIGILAAALPPNLAVVAPPTIDGRVLAFTLLLATVTSFLFGLWPAIGSARVPLNDAIKLGGYGATRQRGRGARGALVVAEMSLALVLLIGAGLLIRSLDRLLRVDAGIRTENVVTARMTLPDAKYDSRIGKATLVTSIVERLRGVAGVSVAGAVNSLPMESEGGIGFRTTPEDAPNDESRMAPASFLLATPGYFKAVGARLRGQDLPATYDSTRKVVVINEALAKVLWPNANPIGKRVVTPIDGAHTVIGVVGDIRTEKLDEPAGPQCYYPLAEAPQSYLAIVVRGDAPAGVLVSRIRDVVRSVDPMQPVYATRTLEDVVHESVAPRRTNAMLLGSFGFVAVLLAAIGVYAVLAYGVAQRTREIGVRVALGAESRDVVRLVVSQGAVLALVGIAIGLAAAFALSRFLNAILYEVSPHDAGVFVAAPALLLVIALLATWLPARRASRVNPVDALRDV